VSEESSLSRRALIIELAVFTVLIVALSVFALWKMNYLSADTAHEVRMTDSGRTAYVAKNIAEGRGYTANDLPTFLIDFYDQRGKLHDENWVNADRFPFTAYAIAALYTVTGQHGYEMGILGYNLICFVALMVMIYWLTRSVWNDRWAGLFALLVALSHPLTYVYLFLKDGDMMLLTTGLLAVFFGWFRRPSEAMSWKRAVVAGTLLAWLLLDRPNIGGGFILYFGFVVARRLWRVSRADGLWAAARSFIRSEGIAFAVMALWCLPFVIHSMSEWGSPFFSANAMYQEPLGTRFAMDTDTWWKYSEPGHVLSFGTLIDKAPGEMIAKFTTSWVATIRNLLHAWPLEIALGVGFFAWLARKKPTATDDAPPSDEQRDLDGRNAAVHKLGAMILFIVVVNFAILPLYGYQGYGYGHYLSFFLPVIWIACGRALSLFVDWIKPLIPQGVERVRSVRGLIALIAVLGLIAWNLGAKSIDTNQLLVTTEALISRYWLIVVISPAVWLLYRPILRIPTFCRGVAIVAVLAVVLFRSNTYVKHLNMLWYPADPAVYDVLRERKGIVASLSPQGEVSWVSDRKNIPVPEWPMHLYSFLFDHKLEIEDVYLESAETMVDPVDGVFAFAAPGFEGYGRLQKFDGKLPGYDLVFHKRATKAYPKYDVKPRPKASSVYRLADRAAVLAIGHSPDRIELGRVDSVIYTAHGWGDYFSLDGKPAVAATDVTRARFTGDKPMKPWEDTSATFFLDDRRPTSIDIDVYGVAETTVQFYWNLDLYYYDEASDRKPHMIGTYTVSHTGWQRVHLDVPPKLTRSGLNKLGFRAGAFRPTTVCPAAMADAACSAMHPPASALAPESAAPSFVVHDDAGTAATTANTSLFVGTVEFNY